MRFLQKRFSTVSLFLFLSSPTYLSLSSRENVPYHRLSTFAPFPWFIKRKTKNKGKEQKTEKKQWNSLLDLRPNHIWIPKELPPKTFPLFEIIRDEKEKKD